jgi:TPR repeat protein
MYLRYACGYRIAKACDALASRLDSGEIGSNLIEAAQLSDFACSQNVAASCHRLSRYYAQGIGVSSDSNRSLDLRVRACELGDEAACQEQREREIRLGGSPAPTVPNDTAPKPH